MTKSKLSLNEYIDELKSYPENVSYEKKDLLIKQDNTSNNPITSNIHELKLLINEIYPIIGDRKVAICGGLFTRSRNSDIDFYIYEDVDDKERTKIIKDIVEKMGKNFDTIHPKRTCFQFMYKNYMCQFITVRYTNIQSIFDTYDFPVCKVGYSFHDKHVHIGSDKTIKQIATRHIDIETRQLGAFFDYRFKNYLFNKNFTFVFKNAGETLKDKKYLLMITTTKCNMVIEFKNNMAIKISANKIKPESLFEYGDTRIINNIDWKDSLYTEGFNFDDNRPVDKCYRLIRY